MNLTRFIERLTQQGVCLTARGDRLRVDAPKGVLTQEDKALLSRYKPFLIQRLMEEHHSLGGIDASNKAREEGAVLGRYPALPETFAWALERQAGQVPTGWTQVAVCIQCGPVWLRPEAPAEVDSCPWCANREERKPIPRPVAVTCGSCRHFQLAATGSIGRCALGDGHMIHPPTQHCPGGFLQGKPLWWWVERDCRYWLPLIHLKAKGSEFSHP